MRNNINKESKVDLGAFNASAGLDRGASRFKEILWYCVKVLFFLSSIPFPNGFKRKILIWFGAKIGRGLVIKPRVNIHFPWKMVAGQNLWLGEEVFILNFEGVSIGDNVCISQRSFLCGGNHNYREFNMPYKNGPIVLDSGCWVGASCFVGPNVEIATDTIIAAGSVITKSTEGNSIYRGNPAVRVSTRWKD
ncbi:MULTISPECIES: WcaF family extracellular polysaccharide biosynthesis acetyltransferase [Olivibacter]|uniref:WcaF family extracellular polysaccharide biosynthesis acetyltransferase n=1 Tax=Olivibacter jilunii TaxID=985016 RepID=A0ABW6B9W5_9SPHI